MSSVNHAKGNREGLSQGDGGDWVRQEGGDWVREGGDWVRGECLNNFHEVKSTHKAGLRLDEGKASWPQSFVNVVNH
ncbi:hypothetical protein HOLleu_00285 [Holothuria leucospilota]|uniref:Uncharacterized protein n=1 Tax=Holothuria leucospilota TaxID=206669 RepID=A0A9Q1CNE7_HOLLE|nr:hypothetical protein HOLleu_00285 [Holothuria leucospilota]